MKKNYAFTFLFLILASFSQLKAQGTIGFPGGTGLPGGPMFDMNANLVSLGSSIPGGYSPTFNASTFNYSATVNNAVTSITVTPTTQSSFATVSVNVNDDTYTSVASGATSRSLNLQPGTNVIKVRVFSQGSINSQIYSINVTRSLAPAITSFAPTSAYVGSLVTITGTDLSGLTAVTIGGVSAIPISITGSKLVAMVMPGTLTGVVTVTTTTGGATSSTNNLTIATAPTPSPSAGIKLIGTNFTGTPKQGSSVSISADGNTAIIGGPGDDSNKGAAWVYTKSNGIWSQQGNKLVGTDGIGNSQQGISVSISADGNTAIFGGCYDNSNQGALWVYTRNNGVWTQQGAKIVATGGVGIIQLGISVSLSADGNTAIAGGHVDDSNQGAVWVFVRINGVWSQQGNKLVGTGSAGVALQGGSVALSADGNTIISGGQSDNSNQGAAWIFTKTNGVWSQQGNKLVGTGNNGAARQGAVAISADGNTAIVGGIGDDSSQGAAWVYTRDNGVWSQQGNKLVGSGSAGTPRQGISVAISADGNTTLVGSRTDNSSQGAVWIYKRSNGIWSQQGNKLVGTGGVASPQHGVSVSISADGNNAIIGGANDQGTVGASWAYTFVATDATLSALTISEGTLDPVFDAATTIYTASVANAITSLTLTPTITQADASLQLRINGGAFSTLTSALASSALALNPGDNTIEVKVTAQNVSIEKTYTITVNRAKATQTITFDPLPSKTFNNADFDAAATASSGLTPTYASSDISVATIVNGSIRIVGAGTATITASQTGDANFEAATDVQQTLTVNKATATLTLSNLAVAYDGTPKLATVTTNPAGLSDVVITYDGSATAPTNAGTYAVVASLTNTNYNTTDATGNLVLAKANQTITFPALDMKTTSDPDFFPGATTTSNLTISYTSSDLAVATIVAGKIDIVGVGNTTITATQAGDANYHAAMDVQQTLTVEAVLPVSFISFDAKLNNAGSVDLTWLTASEKNNSHFIVLKSTDGVNFQELAKISGSGNSNQQNRYHTADNKPANGNNYYQLLQYDTDRKATVLATKVVNVSLNKNNQITVFPNPTQNVVNISFEADAFNAIKLSDMNGKVLIAKSIATNEAQVSLEISNLPSATYIIQLNGKTGALSKTIVKN